jgi:hypothetical protein
MIFERGLNSASLRTSFSDPRLVLAGARFWLKIAKTTRRGLKCDR